MSDINSSYDKLEFRHIVLEHIRNILNLSLKPTQHFQLKTETMNDAVLSLRDVLLPFFDSEMKTAYSEYEKNLEYLHKHSEVIEGNYKFYRFDYSRLLVITRKLFGALNLLLNRNDYLKSVLHGENEDEVVSDDEDNEGDVE